MIFGKTWAVFSKNSDLGGLGQIHVGPPARGGGPHRKDPCPSQQMGGFSPSSHSGGGFNRPMNYPLVI